MFTNSYDEIINEFQMTKVCISQSITTPEQGIKMEKKKFFFSKSMKHKMMLSRAVLSLVTSFQIDLGHCYFQLKLHDHKQALKYKNTCLHVIQRSLSANKLPIMRHEMNRNSIRFLFD